MEIKTITIKHPNINNRDITLLLVDNKIDTPSTEFLIHEARYGGRYNQIAGRTSHKGKAIKMAELYRNLNDFGLDWRNASEVHVKSIRNAMLCWDDNNNEAHDKYPYEAISNDAMNHKIGIWFKFYKYMMKIDEKYDLEPTTKLVKPYKPKGLLGHVDSRSNNLNAGMLEVWALRVEPSPKSNSYRALSRTEFSKLRQHLRSIDIVYDMIALLMVETGLRITAALETIESDFEGLLKLYSSGKTLNDIVERDYIAKGDKKKQYELPLRVMQEINDSYLNRIYLEREYKYSKRQERLKKSDYNEKILWILENGKEVKKHDVWSAFDRVSKIMGRSTNKITPHWLRHTFATWTIMDISEKKGIALENTGITPNPLFISALQRKLGHASALSTMRYINTALKLMGIDVNDGPVKISLRSFIKDKNSQKLVKKEAINEFEDYFDEDYFDVVKYALSRGIVIDDEKLN